jgi:hypothetical protein
MFGSKFAELLSEASQKQVGAHAVGGTFAEFARRIAIRAGAGGKIAAAGGIFDRFGPTRFFADQFREFEFQPDFLGIQIRHLVLQPLDGRPQFGALLVQLLTGPMAATF